MNVEQITYSWDDKQYNVSRFTDEAKLAFACLVESKQEITSLTRKITTLQAATITLSQKINSQLADEMSITPEDRKDSETTKEKDTLTSP